MNHKILAQMMLQIHSDTLNSESSETSIWAMNETTLSQLKPYMADEPFHITHVERKLTYSINWIKELAPLNKGMYKFVEIDSSLKDSEIIFRELN